MGENNYGTKRLFFNHGFFGNHNNKFCIRPFGKIPNFFWNIDSIQNYQFYSSIFSIITMIVNPFLVFIGFYKIGKKFDLKSNLKSLIIRLLSGAYLGHFFIL